jgi:hypothetical protein
VKNTHVTIHFEISARTKRLLLRVGLPAVGLLAIAGIAYASLPHTFASGEVLTAANLNASFQNLDNRISAVEGLQSDTSGTRLTARYTSTTVVGADGVQRVTKFFAGWFDSQRNEYCYATLASDGQQRCIPSDTGGPGVAAVSGGPGQHSYYSDAACTKPIIEVVLDSACPSMPSCSACNPPAPKYFRGSGSACVGAKLYPVGAQITGTTIYQSTPACVSTAAPANTLLYDGSSTTEIPPASFVALTVTTQTQ